MDRVKSTIVVIILGAIFAYLSIAIIGYGAAIAIPSNLIEPMWRFSPTFASAVIDLITLGLPLMISYLVLVQVTKFIKIDNHPLVYLLLAVPFFLLHAFIFIGVSSGFEGITSLAMALPKYILLGLCVGYLSIKWKNNNTSEA